MDRKIDIIEFMPYRILYIYAIRTRNQVVKVEASVLTPSNANGHALFNVLGMQFDHYEGNGPHYNDTLSLSNVVLSNSGYDLNQVYPTVVDKTEQITTFMQVIFNLYLSTPRRLLRFVFERVHAESR